MNSLKEKLIKDVEENYFGWLTKCTYHEDTKAFNEVKAVIADYEEHTSIDTKIKFLTGRIKEQNSFIAFFFVPQHYNPENCLESIFLKEDYLCIIDDDARKIAKHRLELLEKDSKNILSESEK